MVSDLVVLVVDFFDITSDGLEIGTQDSVELLDDGTSLLKILKHKSHVLRSTKDVSDSWEVPPLDSLLGLNLSLGILKLLLPLLEDSLALPDDLDGLVRWLFEDLGNVNL